jgi:hypothetical protein
MNNESKQAKLHLSEEYVFWFHVMRRKLAYYFPWNMPKQLVKVVMSDSNIISDGPIWMGSQDILNIPLANITQIKLSISATAPNGSVEITTQESEHYLLTPTNPLDPTLLSYSNVDEIKSFISVVEDLKASRTPDVDENPYIRQFSKKGTPDYLINKTDSLWDKNVSPWEYYYRFVPESVDKKKHATANVYKIIVLSATSVMVLVALYAIYVQFVW